METGRISEGPGGSPGLVSSGSDKGGNPVSFRSESYSVSRASKPPLTGWRHRFFPSFFQRLTGSVPAFAAAGNLAHGSCFPDPFLRRANHRPGQLSPDFYRPNRTACMIRPGPKVNSPAM